MMTTCEARRSGLVVLSAESAERSTTHPCQSLDVTWLLCHPDLSGLRINGFVPAPPTGPGSTSLEEEVCRLRLGRLLALGKVDCLLAIGHASAISAQLRANRMNSSALKNGGPVAPGPTVSNRYGRLLSAIGRTPALLGPAAAQSAHPCLEEL